MNTSNFPLLARLAGAVFLATAGLACSGVTATPAAPQAGAARAPAPVSAATPATQPGLMQQLQAAVGPAACDTAAQCKTVAVGHKACGGPESYMAYSTKGDSSAVTALAARYAEARKAENQRSGMVSNCMLLSDPGATCSAGRCVTGPGGQGGAAVR